MNTGKYLIDTNEAIFNNIDINTDIVQFQICIGNSCKICFVCFRARFIVS